MNKTNENIFTDQELLDVIEHLLGLYVRSNPTRRAFILRLIEDGETVINIKARDAGDSKAITNGLVGIFRDEKDLLSVSFNFLKNNAKK